MNKTALSAPSQVTLWALGLAGFCAFLNMYSTQPLLPGLRQWFGITSAQAALTVSAPTIAVAIAAPMIGRIADRVGRRRLMIVSLVVLPIPTLLVATSQNMSQMILWRFAQGLVIPGIYAVGISYVGDLCSRGGMARGMAALITGNVIGGFSGRMVSGFAGEYVGWRGAFGVLAVMTLVGAVVASHWLPRSVGEEGRQRPASHPRAQLLHPRLLATYAVGFNVLFVQVATFTYVTFHLASPPFQLRSAGLSWVFIVYLVGALVTPFAGQWIERAGSRRVLAMVLVAGWLGGALTLIPALWAVGLGLALCCTAAFVSQSAATSYLQMAATPQTRSAAAGIYLSCFYLGGSVGGLLPSSAYRWGGWPACVALIAVIQLGTLALAFLFWSDRAWSHRTASAAT